MSLPISNTSQLVKASVRMALTETFGSPVQRPGDYLMAMLLLSKCLFQDWLKYPTALPTPAHRAALQRLGATLDLQLAHEKSFASPQNHGDKIEVSSPCQQTEAECSLSLIRVQNDLWDNTGNFCHYSMPKDLSGKTGTDGKINKLVLRDSASGTDKSTIPLILRRSCHRSLKI